MAKKQTADEIEAIHSHPAKIGELKRGVPSNADRGYIASNHKLMSVSEMANQLNRKESFVRDIIRKMGIPDPVIERTPDAEKFVIRHELRSTEKWKILKLTYTYEELKYFEEEYVAYMAQFRSDVLPSEETQIFDVIAFSILKNRNLAERKKSRESITELEKMQRAFMAKFKSDVTRMDDDDREQALNFETQLNASRSAESSRTSEFTKLQERQDALMKSLKSTRDQRIKELEKSDVNFLSVIKNLNNRDFQEREARQKELMKMAGKKEYARLGQLMSYDDGTQDRPILSAETV